MIAMAKYDDVRCPTCGVFWLPTDGQPAHPVNDTCYRYRPGAVAVANGDAPRPRVPAGPDDALATPGDVLQRRELAALREETERLRAELETARADRAALQVRLRDAASADRLRAEVARLTSDLRIAEAHYRGALKVHDDLRRQHADQARELEWTRAELGRATRAAEGRATAGPAAPPPGARTDVGVVSDPDAEAEPVQLKAEVSRLNATIRGLTDQLLACQEALRGEIARGEGAEGEAARLRAAVRAHHDQGGDDRCRLDDLKLYHDALGEGVDPFVGALPPGEDMEESCRRYIRQRRCPGPEGVVPLPGDMTIAQLTSEVERLRRENAEFRERTGVLVETAAKFRDQREQVARACVYRSSFPGDGQPERWRVGSPLRSGEEFGSVDEAVRAIYGAALVDAATPATGGPSDAD
jgi:hypothetical protein